MQYAGNKPWSHVLLCFFGWHAWLKPKRVDWRWFRECYRCGCSERVHDYPV